MKSIMYETLKLGEIKEEAEARRRSREGSISMDPFQEWRAAVEYETTRRVEAERQLSQAQSRLDMFERLCSQIAAPPVPVAGVGDGEKNQIDFDVERQKLWQLLQACNSGPAK